ncbi:Gph Predicted phosphatases [Candidatus Nanopelagicaceae bacterium]
MTNPFVVAFDLDGTLVNTTPSITKSLNQALHSNGFDQVTLDFVKELVGLPVESLFGHLNVDLIQLRNLVFTFREQLRNNLSSPEDVFPGILEALNYLSGLGVQLIVSTSKPTELSILTLKNVDLFTFFDHVVGTDNGSHKPDPWVLNESAKIARRKIDLYIGDRLEDAEAAQRASIPFVGILHSIHTKNDFNAFPNAAILENSTHLLEFLTDFSI